MNRKELLREVARLHAEHAKKYAEVVPYNPAHEHPHDGQTTDLSLWHVDRSAPPAIDDELNRKIQALIDQLDDTPSTRSAVDDPDTWLRLQQHAEQFLDLPDLDGDAELRRGYKRDPKGRFSSGGGGASGGAGASSAPAKKAAPAKAAPAKKAAAKKAAPVAAAGEAGTGKVGAKMAAQPKVDNPGDTGSPPTPTCSP